MHSYWERRGNFESGQVSLLQRLSYDRGLYIATALATPDSYISA